MAIDASSSDGATAADPAVAADHAAGPGARVGTGVAALLFADRVDDDLVEVLLAIADQTRRPERLRIIDATPAGDLASSLERNTGLRDQLPLIEVDRVRVGTDLRRAVAAAVADLDTAAVWVLTGATRPAPDALHHLSDALGLSPALDATPDPVTPDPVAADPASTPPAALAGPKLLDADRPGRLQRFGIQATRSGRFRPMPAPGQPDQQQFDDRRDALAVPVEGALIRREAYLELGGFDPTFAGLGADLDLGWRARRAGWRVALAPAARVRLRDRLAHPTPVRDRREARRVALTRNPALLAPVLAAWIVVSALAGAVALFLLKRPRAAGRQLADIGALADPWRLAAARWRTRGTPRRGRPQGGYFVPGVEVFAGSLDRLPDLLLPSRRRQRVDPGDQAGGHDPGTERAEPPEHRQALSHPGLWTVLVAGVAALVAGRTLPGGLTGGLRDGFAAGQLTGVVATAGGLWHGWLDSWRGPGLGIDTPGSSALAPMALATWLWQHLPFHEAGANPAGGLVGLLVLLAAPTAALSAYLAGRVLTPRRWPRAVVALAWALSPIAAATLGQGRLGAIALLVLLPPVLAGFHALGSSPRLGAAAAAALPAALLAAFVPAVLVLVVLLAVAVAVAGGARSARRSAAYLVCLLLASAPLLWELRAEPVRLLGGWGLLTSGGESVTPLQVALLTPALETSPWSYAVLPVLVLGVLGLLRRAAPGGPAWFAAGLIVLGVGAAVTAPHVLIGRGAGESPLAPWSGTGMLLALAGLLIAGLSALDRLPARWSRPGAVVATAAAAGIVAGFVAGGLGEQLRPARDPRPAVAADHASGPAAGRSVVVDISRESVSYAVIGREPAAPAPELGSGLLTEPTVESAVGALTASTGATAGSSVRELARWGIGFVVVRPPVPPDVEHRLDATEWLGRIGDYDQSAVWRVEPAAAGAGLTAPARARIVAGGTEHVVPVTGQNGATRTRVQVPAGARLVLAQPAAWARVAEVRLDGRRVEPAIADGRPAYTLPSGAHDLVIEVPSRFPVPPWAYAALLALLAYVAIPLGSGRGSRAAARVVSRSAGDRSARQAPAGGRA